MEPVNVFGSLVLGKLAFGPTYLFDNPRLCDTDCRLSVPAGGESVNGPLKAFRDNSDNCSFNPEVKTLQLASG